MFMFKYERERREKDLNVMGARKETEFEDKEGGGALGRGTRRKASLSRGNVSWKRAEELRLRRVGERLAENTPARVRSKVLVLEEQEVPCGWSNRPTH